MLLPKEVIEILKKLKKTGFEAYVVGGCVRDILLQKKPKDWDITTNAKPEEIAKIFPKNFYTNKFGTVTVLTNADDPTLKEIEITTYRIDEKYSDKRHPDSVKFTANLKEDLARRDFTVNAMAFDGKNIIDPFNGQIDLKNKIIRAVGEPKKRFEEDALRLMRAVRQTTEFSARTKQPFENFDWKIEEKTKKAIIEKAGLINFISKERIRDELIKIINSENAAGGIELLRQVGLLKYIIPELELGYGISQNKHHIYEIYEHNLRSLDYAAKQNFSLEIRLAALLHDIGKPQTKQGEGPDSTFYNHEIVGAKITAKILTRLCFPKNIINKVVHLVRYHLFYYNVGEVTEAGVRRFLRRVGPEYVDDLIKVREADRIGSGVPKAMPYKLRHLLFMIEKVKRDPISPKMLKINGNDVMKILKIQSGPKVGQILSILLDEVLENPKKNTKENLKLRTKELGSLDNKKLIELFKKAKEKKEEFESGIEKEMKKKYWVK